MKEDLIDQGYDRGIKKKHIAKYLEEESILDFEVDNLVKRMFKDKIISEDNGYKDIDAILNPNERRKRRTEAELD